MKARINVLYIEAHSDLSGGGPISLLNICSSFNKGSLWPCIDRSHGYGKTRHSQGITEIVDNRITGVLVPPKDHGALAKTIIDLINDKDKAKRMGLAGRKLAIEFFNISSNAQRTMGLYKELIG